MFFVLLTLCWGNNFRNIEKIFVKTYIRDILRKYEPSFRQITIEELDTMRDILKLKQENLAMLNSEPKNSNENNGYSRKLRKV